MKFARRGTAGMHARHISPQPDNPFSKGICTNLHFPQQWITSWLYFLPTVLYKTFQLQIWFFQKLPPQLLMKHNLTEQTTALVLLPPFLQVTVAQNLVSFNMASRLFTVWGLPLSIYFTVFRSFRAEHCLPLVIGCMEGTRFKEKVFWSIKMTCQEAGYLPWEQKQKQDTALPVFARWRPSDHLPIVGFPFPSDGLESNGTAGEESYEHSAHCPRPLPSLSEDLLCLPLAVMKKGGTPPLPPASLHSAAQRF